MSHSINKVAHRLVPRISSSRNNIDKIYTSVVASNLPKNAEHSTDSQKRHMVPLGYPNPGSNTANQLGDLKKVSRKATPLENCYALSARLGFRDVQFLIAINCKDSNITNKFCKKCSEPISNCKHCNIEQKKTGKAISSFQTTNYFTKAFTTC